MTTNKMTFNDITQELYRIHNEYDKANCQEEDNVQLLYEVVQSLGKKEGKLTRNERIELWTKLEAIYTDNEITMLKVKTIMSSLKTLMERLEENK